MKKLLVGILWVAVTGTAHSDLIEIGYLNIIDDAGNASDGLAFFDMSFSAGKTSADAVMSAQAELESNPIAGYSTARLAIASEFDDLMVAGGMSFENGLTAADGFSTGTSATLSSGTNYNTVVRNRLGVTYRSSSLIAWTSPDGSQDSTTTRDFIRLASSVAVLGQTTATPANSSLGWFVVAERERGGLPCRNRLLWRC